ncbi:leucine-rich repeat domain-containing protein [Streptomyces sp. NPDC002588]|uniref:leucine-rich repeat domain-containing protein n=1 Tax=Streptomyces sp. NPDC002588 TaxID=3154419 RepID=UPI00332D554D
MTEGGEPRLFGDRTGAAGGPAGNPPGRDVCDCLRGGGPRAAEPALHTERQDTSAPGWRRLCELVEEAAADGREVFSPLRELTAEERRQVVTLPPAIAELTAVRQLLLYGSNLVRVPPEIGAMTSLEVFDPYTSYRLHWFPYELTRCANLRDSTVSTRALYGNFKTRLPFPALGPAGSGEAAGVRACSVCTAPLPPTGPVRVWISLLVATDVLPLLVNACSQDCVDALPPPAEGHIATAHRGGPTIAQPPTRP